MLILKRGFITFLHLNISSQNRKGLDKQKTQNISEFLNLAKSLYRNEHYRCWSLITPYSQILFLIPLVIKTIRSVRSKNQVWNDKCVHEMVANM